MTAIEDPLTAEAAQNHIGEALCMFAAEGLCEYDLARGDRCEQCERYADILRQARELYGDVRWVVTPDGLLHDLRS